MLDYMKLEEIKNELNALSKVNFKDEVKYLQKAHKILRNLEKFAENEDEKRFLIELRDKFIKQNNTNDISKSIEKDIASNGFKRLNPIAQEQIFNFQSAIIRLKNNNLSLSVVSLKNRILNLNKLKKLLKEQKSIVFKYVQLINKEEQQRLDSIFLKNESEIYKIYAYMQNVLSFRMDGSDSFKENSQKHMFGSIYNDFSGIVKWIKNNISTTFWICVFFGAAFCLPYFLGIEKFPQVNIDEIVPFMFFVSLYGFLIICYSSFMQIFYSYSIFLLPKESKILNSIFILIQILLFSLIIAPFLEKIIPNDYLKIFFDNFDKTLMIYLVLIISYFGFYIYKNKKFLEINMLTFFIVPVFDFLFVLFVYYRYQDINFILLLIAIIIVFMERLLAYLKIFEYKLLLFLSLIFSLLAFFILSSNFVKMINLANYKENFIIKKEFIPKEILNLPVCFEGYHLVCINENLSDDKKIKIDNLVVEVKSEDRYYFKAEIKDSFKFPISKKQYFENLANNSYDKNSSMQLLDHNDTHMTIKNYKSLFYKPDLKNNGEFIIKFNIHKKNIEN